MTEPRMIYLATRGGCMDQDFQIMGVFSTREKADAYAAMKCWYGLVEIQEYQLDDPTPPEERHE